MTIDKKLSYTTRKMNKFGISKDIRRKVSKSTYSCFGKMMNVPDYLIHTLGKLEASTEIKTPKERGEYLEGWIVEVYNSPFSVNYKIEK